MDTLQYSTPASRAQYRPQASTKHHVVDGRFAEILSDDYGLEWGIILESLTGEPKKAAIKVCESKKNKRGTYRPNNTPSPEHTTTTPPTKEVGSESLRGAVPVAMAVSGLERMEG